MLVHGAGAGADSISLGLHASCSGSGFWLVLGSGSGFWCWCRRSKLVRAGLIMVHVRHSCCYPLRFTISVTTVATHYSATHPLRLAPIKIMIPYFMLKNAKIIRRPILPGRSWTSCRMLTKRSSIYISSILTMKLLMARNAPTDNRLK